jgi:ABC-type multidrug transport system permease subunit
MTAIAERSRRLETIPAPRVTGRGAALTTLTRRRFALSARTPREIIIPLLTPILFADVIAPALARTTGTFGGIDYMSFVAIGTVGLLVPLSCILGGIGMIVDRESGAQRDMLAAPIPRGLMVFGNLGVAVFVASLQVGALLVAARLRGAAFNVSAGGVAWFVLAAIGIAVAMHGAAEILAVKLPKQEEYVGAAPAVALVPWFFAGSFFRISAMPAGLTVFAKVLPLTHALALMRYAMVDHHATGLRDIWGMHSVTAMAALSLLVVAAFAAVMLLIATRVFARDAVR